MSMPLLQIGPGGTYTTTYVPRGRGLVAITGDLAAPRSGNGEQDASSSSSDAGSGLSAFRRMLRARRLTGAVVERAAPGMQRRTLLDRVLGADRVEISARAAMRAAGQSQRATNASEVMAETVAAAGGIASAMLEGARAWLAAQRAVLEQAMGLLARLGQQFSITQFAHSAGVPAAILAGARSGKGFALATRLSTPFAIAWDGESRTGASASRLIARANTVLGGSHESHTETTQDSATDSRIAHRAGLFADDAGTRRRTRHQQGHRVRARRGAHQERRAQARSQQGSLFVHL
jgi:hypothetical protein